MAILVTGGAGFIGSHLLELLLRETSEPVVVLDNFNQFYDPAQKRRNIAHSVQNDRCTLVEGDISSESTVESVWRDHDISDVIHLAANAGVRPSLDRPRPYVRANVSGTLVLLEAARQFGCRRFINASSATVYGNDAPAPFQEDRLGTTPASPYGVTKRSAELLCRLYYELYRVPILSLRFFSAYGPRLRPDLALSIFTRSILADQPLPLIGGGSARRDFTYITDIVAGTFAAWKSDLVNEEINLGHEEPIAIIDLISILEETIGKKADIKHLPEKPGEMKITSADVTKARKLLGYDPQTPIREGVQHFVSWYQESHHVT